MKREAPSRDVHRRAQPYPKFGQELERQKNVEHGKLVSELLQKPKSEQPWSGAETPAGRKLMKEGDTAFHFDSGKPRVDQTPPRAMLEIAKVFGYGAKKYGDWNWARYANEWEWGQLLGSTLRHLYAWMMREDLDPESGLHHLAHAGCNVMMLLELILTQNGKDNRNPIGD
jgi:hypothetical protein